MPPTKIPTSLFLKVTAPKKRIQRRKETTITGKTAVGAVISVNGVQVKSDEKGKFQAQVSLQTGKNQIVVEAEDIAGNRKIAKLGNIIVKPGVTKVHSKASRWGTHTRQKK